HARPGPGDAPARPGAGAECRGRCGAVRGAGEAGLRDEVGLRSKTRRGRSAASRYACGLRRRRQRPPQPRVGGDPRADRGPDGALVVPSQAVMTGQQGTYVFVLNQDGTARSQPVTVERPAGAYAVIAQGVRPGEEVVTDGQVRLVNGAPVEVKASADPARAMEGDK